MLNKTLFAVVALLISFSVQAQKWEDLNNQVLTYLGSGDYQNALSTAIQARTVARQEFGENHADYSASLHNLASAHKKLGEYTPAEALYWEALKIDKQVLGAKHQNYALSLFGLANLYKLKKDFPKAESIYLDALDIMERAVTDKHPDYALILSDYADLHTELKNFKKAESNLKRAKDITRYSVGEKHQDYAGVLFHYGKYHKSKGSVSSAEESLIKAVNIYKRTLGESHPDYKDCKRFLDNLYDPTYQLYKPAASETQMTKTIERPGIRPSGNTSNGNEEYENNSSTNMNREESMVKEDMSNSVNSGIGNNTGGNSNVTKGESMNNSSAGTAVESAPRKMETMVKEETKIETPPPPRPKKKTWNDYSITMDKYTQSGDYTQAIAAGEKAMEMVRKEFGEEHENFTWISLKLADSYENAGLVEKAIPLYEKDLAYIAKALGKDNRTYQKRREELLEAYKTTGQKEKAQEFYKKEVYVSYEIFNDASLMNQNKMIEKMEQEFEDYYSNSLEMGFLISGTEMQNFNLGLKGRDTDAALLIENSMKGEITTYQNQLRDKLKLNEAAIDFLRMKDKNTGMGNYYALVTRKGAEETVLVPLLDESKIRTLIDSKPDSKDSYIQSMDRSSQLYQLVWEPLEEHLKGVNFIHVSTAGILNKVAFSGLMDYQKNSLADKYEIYYYSSLRDFINDTSSPQINESVAFFGGVDFGGGESGKLNYMPGTKDEVKAFKVVCAAKGWSVDTKIGNEASEMNLKKLGGMNAPGVLHLATPVYFEHLEEFSGIALANANSKITSGQFSDNDDDGILNAKEIAKMDLSKVNLVLLSATETASDKNSDKGILAIQRALKAAGVDTILFSQWKLPDKQVQEMLALFYFNHLSGMDTHKAFYTAQNDIRKLYNSPYYWAGFILIE